MSYIGKFQLFIICLIIFFCIQVQAQKFNVFKSYKDAKVKPDRYGKTIQKDHDIREYLSENQMKMLKERTGPDTPDNSFDNSWSGFKDKSVQAQARKNRMKSRKIRTKGSAEGDLGEYLPGSNEARRLEAEDNNSQYSLVFGLLLIAVFFLNFLFLYQSFYPTEKYVVENPPQRVLSA